MEKEARTGINPRTKKIEIPARKVVKFKPAADLGKIIPDRLHNASGAFLNQLPSPPAPGAVLSSLVLTKRE